MASVENVGGCWPFTWYHLSFHGLTSSLSIHSQLSRLGEILAAEMGLKCFCRGGGLNRGPRGWLPNSLTTRPSNHQSLLCYAVISGYLRRILALSDEYAHNWLAYRVNTRIAPFTNSRLLIRYFKGFSACLKKRIPYFSNIPSVRISMAIVIDLGISRYLLSSIRRYFLVSPSFLALLYTCSDYHIQWM